jgi:uncharacterized glyoxalase superfamily protein PhnB
MSDTTHIPPGWPAVVPRLFVADAQALVAFIQNVFDARGDYLEGRPTELWIGNGLVMVADITGREAATGVLYVYVADTDGAYARALARGARSIEPPAEMPYGDRRAMVEDRWGNRWQIATHRRFANA